MGLGIRRTTDLVCSISPRQVKIDRARWETELPSVDRACRDHAVEAAAQLGDLALVHPEPADGFAAQVTAENGFNSTAAGPSRP